MRFMACLGVLLLLWLPWKGLDYLDLYTRLRASPFYGRDLRMTHFAVGLAWRDGFRDIYNLPAFRQWAGAHGLEVADTEYPPLTYLLHYPLTGLEWPDYVNRYFLLNQVWAVGIVALLAWAFWPVRGRQMALLAGPLFMALVWNAPSIDSLMAGQVNHFLALLMMAFCAAWLRGYRRLAGLPLGLGISVKLAPVVFLLLVVRQRDGRILAHTLAWLAFFTVVGVVGAGLSAYLGFLGNLPRIVTAPNGFGNCSLSGLFKHLFTANPEWMYLANLPLLGTLLGTLTSLLVVVWSYRSMRRLAADDTLGLSRQLALTMLVMLIALSRSWNYYGLYAVVAWLLLWLPDREEKALHSMVLSTALIALMGFFGAPVGGSQLRVYIAIIFSWHLHLNLWVYLGLWVITLRLLAGDSPARIGPARSPRPAAGRPEPDSSAG